MKIKRLITQNLSIVLLFILLFWAVMLLFRIAFFFWIDLSSVPAVETVRAFYVGVRFDGRIAALISVPLMLFLFLPYLGRCFHKTRRFLLWFYALAAFLLVTIYIGDAGYYEYLSVRLNYHAFELLEDVDEAVGMVWASYPVLPMLIAALLFTAAVTFAIKKIFDRWNAGYRANKKAKFISGFVCFWLVAILIYGQYWFVWMPLRWSEVYLFTKNQEAFSLALNPLQNTFDTRPRRTSAKAYDLEAAKDAFALVAGYLRIDGGKELDFARSLPPVKKGDRPNIVLIVGETLSTSQTSFFSDELNTTPFLKSLAAESLYFPNFYSNARTTAKAMFTILTGIPDDEQRFDSASRNIDAIDQRVILDQLDGYRKVYMLGGNAGWANIRGIFAGNVSDLVVLEDGYWKSERLDTWGITDLDMFIEGNDYLKKLDQPFIAFIQTASNHRPFSIPRGREGFDYSVKPSKETLDRFGMAEEGEFTGMRFFDFAIGEFLRLAKKESYFENTIFIITGDHGANHGFSEHSIKLFMYHVPLVIYSPKYFPRGRVITAAAGHTDLFPTIASLIGQGYTNYALGRDIFDERFGDERFVAVMRLHNTPLLISKSRMIESGRKMAFEKNETDVRGWRPAQWGAEDEKLNDLALGIQEASRYLLYNNKKERR
ncbi:MAG: sulfatase-like hydrolase/transferase [Helicobacteraceae bacterium]|jgi:phosphoglycerol transferase MdoB-like AlkP superfamily enzyme|nr:sulfatase-like hydrolase/transferase [Helicobacteraceae bacterium]